jgi:hypothetical protein
MPAVKNQFTPQPYQSLQSPILHSGLVPVTGSAVVNLGIGHNNFVPSVSLQTPGLTTAPATAANVAPSVTWQYGPGLGQFTIYTWKATSTSNPTLIAATVAATVSFTAIADSSVG